MAEKYGKGYFLKPTRKPEEAPWYQSDIESVLQPQTRAMLEQYTGVPPEKLLEHIKVARDRSWDICPYPSVGALTWLNSYMLLHEAHQTILDKVKAGASILDCGCMVSPDLRQLAFEGAPTDQMYAFDIEPRFFDVGFDFYNDRERWKGHFLTVDGSKELDETPLKELKGKLDIIWCPKFLHLFERAKQIAIAAKLIQLLKPQTGSMFVGSQNGFPDPHEAPVSSTLAGSAYKTIWLGNAEALKQMWAEVAEITGTEWDVQARLFDMRTVGLHTDDGSEYKRRTGYNLQWTAVLK